MKDDNTRFSHRPGLHHSCIGTDSPRRGFLHTDTQCISIKRTHETSCRMARQIRTPPPIEYRRVHVRKSGRLSPLVSNRRLTALLSIAIVLGLLLSIAWPESTSDRTYEGEVWGDLRAEGFIWGEHRAEHDRIYFRHRSDVEGEGLRANVTNVSSIRLFDPPDGDRINVTVECLNRSFVIIADNASIRCTAWDVDFRCIYQEFNSTFPGVNIEYWPDEPSGGWRAGHSFGTTLRRNGI